MRTRKIRNRLCSTVVALLAMIGGVGCTSEDSPTGPSFGTVGVWIQNDTTSSVRVDEQPIAVGSTGRVRLHQSPTLETVQLDIEMAASLRLVLEYRVKRYPVNDTADVTIRLSEPAQGRISASLLESNWIEMLAFEPAH
jgi:hypothetical protein